MGPISTYCYHFECISKPSFDYDVTGGAGTDNLEQFPSAAAEGANRLFAALQSQAGWFHPNGTTKTAFALKAL